MVKKIFFKKIKFINFDEKNFKKIIKKKGTFIFPAGPALATIENSKKYYLSLLKADYIFFDSGLFVLLLKIFKNIKVSKFSGFKFINLFLKFIKKNKKKIILSIDPNKDISVTNKNYFKKMGIIRVHSYIAPIYTTKRIDDKKLLKLIKKIGPHYIIVNLGGTKQEILAHYLQDNFKKKQTILCTGAALSFFTGKQAPINMLYDKLYFGWLVRILFNPKVFLKRYLSAFKFIPIFFKNKIIIE